MANLDKPLKKSKYHMQYHETEEIGLIAIKGKILKVLKKVFAIFQNAINSKKHNEMSNYLLRLRIRNCQI